MANKTIRVVVKGAVSLRSCSLSVPEAPHSVRRITFVLQPGGEFAGSKDIVVTTTLNMTLKLQGLNGTDYAFEYHTVQADGTLKKFDSGDGTISGGFYRREKDYALADL